MILNKRSWHYRWICWNVGTDTDAVMIDDGLYIVFVIMAPIFWVVRIWHRVINLMFRSGV